MKSVNRSLVVSLLVLGTSNLSYAAEYEVGQQDKKFTATELKLKVGDTVKFTNNDPFFHNVFSLSDIKFFDLGSYPKGEFRTVTFEEAGVVDVECAIHPAMRMTVTVE